MHPFIRGALGPARAIFGTGTGAFHHFKLTPAAGSKHEQDTGVNNNTHSYFLAHKHTCIKR